MGSELFMLVKSTSLVDQVYPLMVEWRRDFHKYAEPGWLEFRTASLVAARLEEWGYELQVGKEVVDKNSRMGVPSLAILAENEKRALLQGANKKWLPHFLGGFTGVVGILDTKRKGPTIAIRFDMDALDLQESDSENHIPVKRGFDSVNRGSMHACGHDAHTSIGLGLAKTLATMGDQLNGKIKLIFQPAEEGVRGAKSMVEAGVLDDVDIFFASHVGIGVPLGDVVSGIKNILATTKIDVSYIGKSSHAGGSPEEGKNALLAASTAVLNIHSIPRHSSGQSQVNVGVLNAGSGRNIIPGTAEMKVETRGVTTEINTYMLEKTKSIIKGSAEMYTIEYTIEVVGEAKTSNSNEQLKNYIEGAISAIPEVNRVHSDAPFPIGSEDATFMMNKVQENNGLASYMIFGTTLTAGHHNERFDIDETVMKIAVKSFVEILTGINKLK